MSDTVQLVKRFAREGNEDVEITLLDCRDTVLEGIAEHAEQKYQLTSLLKYGGTLTQDDIAFLEDHDLSEAIRIDQGKILIGTAISEKILTPEQKLTRILQYLHGKGSRLFELFIEKFEGLLSDLYLLNWEYSYSANNGRFVAALIKKLEEDGIIKGNDYADLACGPLVLEQMFAQDTSRERDITSLDLNPEMLRKGKELLAQQKPDYVPKYVVGKLHKMSTFKDESFDVVNVASAVNFTRLNTRLKHAKKDERLQSLMEINRITKTGGIVIITLPNDVGTDEELSFFKDELERFFGFEVLKDYSGEVNSNSGNSAEFRNNTIVCKKIAKPNFSEGIYLHFLRLSKTQRQVIRPEKKGIGTRNYVHNIFTLNGKRLSFNVDSKELRKQEEYLEKVAEARYYLEQLAQNNDGSLDNLPQHEYEKIKEMGIILVTLPKGKVMFFIKDHEMSVPEIL